MFLRLFYVADLENPSQFYASYTPLASELSLGISSRYFEDFSKDPSTEQYKEQQTLSNIGRILEEARAFYFATALTEGRGRFPGQIKYNDPAPSGGGYTYDSLAGEEQSEAELQVVLDLKGNDSNGDGDFVDAGEYTAPFTTFDNTTEALLWSSVFGTDNSDARAPDGSNINDAEDPHSGYYSSGDVVPGVGGDEFLDAFTGRTLTSPFQDGHYIYTVIGGTGSGTAHVPPVIYVADLENPSQFYASYTPLASELSLGISSPYFEDFSKDPSTERHKEQQTLSNIGRILEEARAFYFATALTEGRGRFPGQVKYNDPAPSGGGYTYDSLAGEEQSEAELQVVLDLKGNDSNGDGDFDDAGEAYSPFYYI